MLQRLVWILGALATVYGLPAGALGLGAIEVSSHLNQPFSAVITLYSLSPDDASSLQVQLAPAAEFQKANIDRADYLSSLRFTVNGGRVKVSSDQPVRDPFLNLLVEARAGSSRVLRSYTILFDPPGIAAPVPAAAPAAKAATPAANTQFYETADESSKRGTAAAAPAAAKPTPVPVPAPAPSASAATVAPATPAAASPAPVSVPPPAPAPAKAAAPVAAPVAAPAADTAAVPPAVNPTKPAPAAAPPAAAPAAPTRYGPVRAGQTFWNIATQLRPSNSVTLDQTMLAIYEGNPSAFADGFNGLIVGSTLNVPTEEKMRSVPPDEAHKRVLALRSASTAQSAATAAAPEKAPAIPAASAARKPDAVAAPAPTPPAPVAAKPIPTPAPAAVPPSASTPATPSKPDAVPAPPPVPAISTPVEPEPAKPAAPKPEPAPAPAAAQEKSPPAETPVAPAAVSLDQQAAPPPADAEAPASGGETEPGIPALNPDGAPEAAASDSVFAPNSRLALIAAAVVFVGVLLLTTLRRRRQTATFRRDSIQDYMRPSAAREAPGMTSSGPVAAKPVPAAPSETVSISPGLRGDPLLAATRAAPLLAPTPAPALAPTGRTAPDLVWSPTPAEDEPTPEPELEPLPEPDLEPELEPQLESDAAAEIQAVDEPIEAAADLDLSTPATPSLHSEDPLAQADFHLSYGLYDEAIRGLLAALVRNPARQELALKLADTYFAAGLSADFESLAESLKDRVSASEWERLSGLGRQLCPDSSVFKPSISPAARPILPTAPPLSLEPVLELQPEPEPMPEPEPEPEPEDVAHFGDIRPTPRSSELRFDARSDLRVEPRGQTRLDLPSDLRPEPRSESRSEPLFESRIEPRSEPRFELRLDSREEPQPEPRIEAPKAPQVPSFDPRADLRSEPRQEPRFEVRPGRVAPRLEPRFGPLLEPEIESQPPSLEADQDHLVEFRLEPLFAVAPQKPDEHPADPEPSRPAFDLTPPPSGRRDPVMPSVQSPPPVSEEEVAVKLDLARAYIEMGDTKTARNLLLEVADQGSLLQKVDARALLQGLPG